MRVLLVASPAFYNHRDGIVSPYNGGGWMYIIQKELIKNPNIELGICFRGLNKVIMEVQDGVHYYGYSEHKKKLKDKILDLIHYGDASRDETQWPHYLNQARIFVDDFKPNIIHIFGSETYNQLIALIGKEKKIPTALHIQGLLSIYYYSILPPSVSKWQYCWRDGFKYVYQNFQELVNWKRSVYREKKILTSVDYIIGRTKWDYQASCILAPQAKYIYGGEMLRPEFYDHVERSLPKKLTIISISSKPLYKGFDIILKTAYILKNDIHLDFVWQVYGNVTCDFWEKHLGIMHEDVCVKLCGVASATQLRKALSHSTVYFQSSYIENSPNSVAEAQLLRIPVVATNVGGTESMVENGETGFLFPATDPYMAAYYIQSLYLDTNLNKQIGDQGKKVATTRHDIHKIMEKLIQSYEFIRVDYNKLHL